MHEKFGPIMEYLEKDFAAAKHPASFDLKIYPSYNAALDALVTGDCDFVRFGPASYIKAKERNPDIRLLVMEHKNKQKRFSGVFIVSQDSTISSIHDLKGKTFAFGDKLSTIGRYLSQAELVRAGIKASDLKSFSYLGRHDKVAMAVGVGNYDAGVVKINTFKKFSEKQGLKEIGRFDNVTKPWVVRAGFNDELFILLQKSLLGLTDKVVLKKLKQHGFLKTTDNEYDFVRKGMALSTAFED